MKIDIDFDRCESHGLCALTAPEVFWIDDDGYTQFVPEPPESERDAVEQAIDGCPMQAIKML
ncbi:ferredoxin [Tamaricihabitans halophyticus]|uniref:Ferredoxin n=1 Tax=Tamaricihabitans halophyticus TaxID=1262583 RepID=A0A4V6NRG7_9PSEU|nr:ferredoxin [Tamaricihabitans halophyticus]TCP57266.1 ferredoxin [Tamaricihabitans halophyticus]